MACSAVQKVIIRACMFEDKEKLNEIDGKSFQKVFFLYDSFEHVLLVILKYFNFFGDTFISKYYCLEKNYIRV